jgi:hypothetical protein
MAQLVIDEEIGSELDQAEVVGGLLLPANERAAEPIELRARLPRPICAYDGRPGGLGGSGCAALVLGGIWEKSDRPGLLVRILTDGARIRIYLLTGPRDNPATAIPA